ncbi:MAG TPA: hypothetical protein VG939_22160 [Caulobacteraceae bacterium]|nr:hypothetical protein [Caulobacteraceae bacterium]
MPRKVPAAAQICSLALVAGALCAAPSPSLAAPASDYFACDGYGAPSGEGDGMTRYATVLGIFNPPGKGTTDRLKPGVGATAVAACTRAIDDLPAPHWMRRVSLLRARAAHRLEAGETTDAALADLDSAAASGRDDADYRRSLGLGVDLLRAYALRRAGKSPDADALALEALKQRPFSRGIATATLFALGPNAPDADIDTAARALARIRPEALELLYGRALEGGRYGEALALYPQLKPTERPLDGFYNEMGLLEFELNNRLEAQQFWAWHAGEAAFALAALGKTSDAHAMLDSARARLAHAVEAPPIPPAETPKQTQRRMLTLNYNARILAQATPILDQWSALTDLRLRIVDGQGAAVARQLATSRPPANWATLDLLQALALEQLPESTAIAGAAQALKARLASAEHDIPEAGVTQLLNSLPEPEVAGRTPPYREAKRPLLAMKGSQADDDAQGYRVGQPTAEGVLTIRFRGDRSTEGVVEEMALLHAAVVARNAGKKGFIVVGARDTKHSVVTTYYGSPLRSDPNGFDSEYDVVLVDPAALPPAYRESAWRVLDADAVFNALGPIYINNVVDPPRAGS